MLTSPSGGEVDAKRRARGLAQLRRLVHPASRRPGFEADVDRYGGVRNTGVGGAGGRFGLNGFDLDTSVNLGLSIVRTLVESELGGLLELRPRSDRGARAVVDVPLE